MPKPDAFLITCEHGGNRIPPRYRPLFAGFEALLASHRGYDPGALALARDLASALAAPLSFSTTSRLLIDLNRSPGHPALYSEATRHAPPEVRRAILETHYLPYRARIEAHVAAEIAAGRRLIHVASHSFAPVLGGEVRNADLGLLYDPARHGELELCRRWQAHLRTADPAWRVRRNYPYTGRSDGLAAYLRKRFAADDYVGVELEINQGHALAGGRRWRALRGDVVVALRAALAELPPARGRAVGPLTRATPACYADQGRQLFIQPVAGGSMAALTKAQIDQLNTRLKTDYQALLREVREELDHPDDRHRIDQLNAEPGDSGDESVANALADLNVARIDRHVHEIRDIEDAFRRLKAGEYGVCIDCGDDIGFARLQAWPTAKRCLVCQEKRERTYAHEGHPRL